MSFAGVICLQHMESNMETISFSFFGKGVSTRDKAWKANTTELLYGEGVSGAAGGSLTT